MALLFYAWGRSRAQPTTTRMIPEAFEVKVGDEIEEDDDLLPGSRQDEDDDLELLEELDDL